MSNLNEGAVAPQLEHQATAEIPFADLSSQQRRAANEANDIRQEQEQLRLQMMEEERLRRLRRDVIDVGSVSDAIPPASRFSSLVGDSQNLLRSPSRYALLVRALRAVPSTDALIQPSRSLIQTSMHVWTATSSTDQMFVVGCRTLERAAESFRHVFGEHRWNPSLLSWLTSALVDTSDSPTFSCYVDILRVLRTRVHKLVESQQLCSFAHSVRFPENNPAVSSEFARAALERALVTFVSTPLPSAPPGTIPAPVPEHKFEFNSSPLLVLCPGETDWNHSQLAYWRSRFAILGDAQLVVMTMGDSRHGKYQLKHNPTAHIVNRLASKITKLSEEHSHRPIVLIGKGVGGRIACEVSATTPVAGVVCLGFPLLGLHGISLEDSLLQTKIPVLFVIGSRASATPLPLMEKVRRQMRARNVVAIIDGAADSLRVTPFSLRSGSTNQPPFTATPVQEAVDDRIIQAIGGFIQSVVNRPKQRVLAFSTPQASQQQQQQGIQQQQQQGIQQQQQQPQPPPPQAQQLQHQQLQQPQQRQSDEAQASALPPSIAVPTPSYVMRSPVATVAAAASASIPNLHSPVSHSAKHASGLGNGLPVDSSVAADLSTHTNQNHNESGVARHHSHHPHVPDASPAALASAMDTADGIRPARSEAHSSAEGLHQHAGSIRSASSPFSTPVKLSDQMSGTSLATGEKTSPSSTLAAGALHMGLRPADSPTSGSQKLLSSSVLATSLLRGASSPSTSRSHSPEPRTSNRTSLFSNVSSSEPETKSSDGTSAPMDMS
ncbi:hypothetical protein CAOG_000278 [Capsaspora owczarzaki ATCC 30864]|uniref:KANL3/Tex30 alpha/beta hydrolase-like domain-containing protein n=1 Tax=Capsaspora owczarzaki (strain ATCC 30864) TaxID=595528 RepID=A0A0D2U0D8_CAPO3|nr:hypothetical protein CAOG_000278 [Capsaspora owczarzaki ATCC 30864]